MSHFPFGAVVGQDEAKLVLMLAAVEPAIGGVLLRGQKGSAKTTLARGLARLLADDAPFVELPIGTTEDRLVGSIDLAAALTGGEVRFAPGLLAAAHGGVLYVDEVNLLPDHLVDVLLDVAVSGVNRVEREGVSHIHPSRFVLIGSMNPEEGDLRPQLLDRFGLAADVAAPADPAERAEAVRRRMAYDADPAAFVGAWPDQPLAAHPPATLPDELAHTVSVLCASVGAEGLPADLVICRAAAALAGREGRGTTTVEDVRRVTPLALVHRRRRQPFDDAGMAPDEIDQALEQAAAHTGAQDGVAKPDEPPERIARLEAPRATAPGASGRRSMVEGLRGRLVGSREPSGTLPSVAVGPTIRAAAARRATYARARSWPPVTYVRRSGSSGPETLSSSRSTPRAPWAPRPGMEAAKGRRPRPPARRLPAPGPCCSGHLPRRRCRCGAPPHRQHRGRQGPAHRPADRRPHASRRRHTHRPGPGPAPGRPAAARPRLGRPGHRRPGWPGPPGGGEGGGGRGSLAGRAFLGDALIEQAVADGVRVFVPLLDGTDRVGVLAFTSEKWGEDDRRLARRFGGLLADVLVTKGMYTDRFFQARRRQPMSLPAEMQWALLPPLMMTNRQVALAGILEPAYDVAGDSFDYALNDDALHVAIIDAMGHGLDAAVMATVAVAAYRHARRDDVELPDLYAAMDRAIAGQFDEEHFVTVQMAHLDVGSGRLRWVNAGHPHPLLLRRSRVVRALDSPTTLPLGFGGADPQVSEEMLEPGDRVLFFTDGITEEHLAGGELFGEAHLIDLLEQVSQDGGPVQETVRRLSHALKTARGDVTNDDATLFLLEWRGGTADHLAKIDVQFPA